MNITRIPETCCSQELWDARWFGLTTAEISASFKILIPSLTTYLANSVARPFPHHFIEKRYPKLIICVSVITDNAKSSKTDNSFWIFLQCNSPFSETIISPMAKPSGQIITCMKIKFRLFIPPQLIIKVGFKFI